MKQNFTFLNAILMLSFFLMFGRVNGQTSWQPLGPDDLNQPYAGGVSWTSVAIHPVTGEAYMAYNAYGEPGAEGFVRKFSSVTGLWENVGEAFSLGSTSNLNLVFDSAGTLFIAYGDSQNTNKATVKKFNQVSGLWDLVGLPGLSAGTAQNITLCAGTDNTLYVGYRDGAMSGKATVKKFDGTAWINVGVAGFSVANTTNNSLTVAPNGTLYMAYTSYISGQMKASVMNFNGSAWEILGAAGFSSGGTSYTKMAVNPISNVPYIAYSDFGSGYKAVVKKFNGTAWENVGTAGFSPTLADRICFDISSDGTPFIGYQSGSVGGKSTVMKFTGTTWTVVGQQSFSVGTVTYTDIALYGNIPYMSFSDYFNGNKATLMKFDGAEWVCLGGTIGFSEEATRTPDNSGLRESDLIVTADGVPYAGYAEASNNSYTTVKKYNYTTNKWEVAGAAGFSGFSAKNISMASSGNTVYIGYTNDDVYPHKATVKKLNGSTWETVGTPNFTANSATYSTIAVSQIGTPYMVFADGSNSGKATVMKYNGTAWETVGSTGFSPSEVYDTTIIIGPDGTPYVAYTCATSPGSAGFVMKFNGIVWEAVGGTFSSSQSKYPCLKFGPDGYLYVAFMDYGINKGNVKKYNGTVWETVGGAFSEGVAQEIDLAINSAGHLYVIFKDYQHQDKATVVRYNGTAWVPVGTAVLSAGAAHWPALAITPDDHAILTYSSPCTYSKTADVHCYTTPPQSVNQAFCFNANATVNNLIAEGENLKWYNVAEFGVPLGATVPLVDGSTYYVSQMLNDCEGPRTAITVTINEIMPPEGPASGIIEMSDASNATLADIEVTGNDINWYDAQGNLLPLSTQLMHNVTYYASQTINDCESSKLAVTAQLVLAADYMKNREFSYYPNPVTSKLHIISNKDIITYLEVYTTYGQKVIHQNWNSIEGELNMSDLAEGVYFICMHGEKSKHDFFIIKR